MPLGAQLAMGLSSGPGTCFAGVSPGLAQRTAADGLREESIHSTRTAAVLEQCVADLFSQVDASCSCRVQGEARWAVTLIRSWSVHAEATSLTDARIQFALVDVCACDSIDGRLTTGTLMRIPFRCAQLAGTPPGFSDRVAALGA